MTKLFLFFSSSCRLISRAINLVCTHAVLTAGQPDSLTASIPTWLKVSQFGFNFLHVAELLFVSK